MMLKAVIAINFTEEILNVADVIRFLEIIVLGVLTILKNMAIVSAQNLLRIVRYVVCCDHFCLIVSLYPSERL